MNLRSLFKKSSSGITPPGKEENLIIETKNWYSERYESILIQRNILALFVILSIFTVLMSILSIGKIASSKSIEPFVVEIEDKTGITNIVNPLSKEALTVDDALNTYFLVQYIRARETYSATEYEYNYNKLMRLFSTSPVYYEFKRYAMQKNYISTYGSNNSTTLKIRSIQFLEPGKTAQIRFTVSENGGNKANFNKIVTIGFAYFQMELPVADRFINPLGFQVTSYVVSDEID